MNKPGDITYTAVVSADEIVIREARYAGTDGPIFSAEFDGAGRPDTDDLDDMLKAQGFERSGRAWVLVKSYEGLWLEVTLDRI